MPFKISDSVKETLLSRITSPSRSTKHHKIILYGVPSTGKTVAAAAMGIRNFMIMSETGDSVLTKPIHSSLLERTERVQYKSINQIRGYAYLLQNGDMLHDHLIIDNMSGVQDKKLSENMEDPSIKDNPKIGRVHPDLSTQQDYQIVAHQMRPMMVDIMDLENHDVTIICHLRPADPDRREFQARPDLTKAIFNLANEKADVVGYVHKDRSGRRLIQTISTDQFIGKSRITEESVMPLEDFVNAVNEYHNS